jgi:polyhydroxyalkanoate synthesis regulator phasin
MVREQLQTAASHLAAASEAAADDASERLTDLAEQLENLSTADRGPDHGRMARIQNALSDLKADASAEVVDEIDAAKGAISAYRETVQGV